MFAPEFLRSAVILLAVPRDEVPIWAGRRWLWQRGIFVEGKNFLQQNGEGAPVEQRVVERPRELPVFFAEEGKVEPEQWGLVHGEAAGAILLHPSGEMCGVFLHAEWHRYFPINLLQWLRPIPAKCRAQHRVPSHHPLPRSAQPRNIHGFVEWEHELLYVHAGTRLAEGME